MGALAPTESPGEGELIMITGSVVSFAILTPAVPTFPGISEA